MLRKTSFRLVIVTLMLAALGPARASTNHDDTTRVGGILSPYTPGFVVDHELRVEPHGRGEADERVTDFYEDRTGEAASAIKTALQDLERRCALAGGQYDGATVGFLGVTATYALQLHAENDVGHTRVIVRGTTAYVGVTDQEPGRFWCDLRHGVVELWIFEPGI